MKITANKRDEILRRKEEYEADKAVRQAKYDSQYRRYNMDTRAILNSVEQEINDMLESVNIPMVIEARKDFDFKSDADIISVKISDERHGNFGEERSALLWNYTVKLTHDGEVQAESGSWSGLEATTPANLTYLKELVKAIELLQNADWAHILNRILPDHAQYITERNPSHESHEDFDAQLFEADLEDCIGANKLIQLEYGAGKHFTGAPYIYILKETPKTYNVIEFPESAVQSVLQGKPTQIAYDATVDNLADYVADAKRRGTFVHALRKSDAKRDIIQPLKVVEF